MISLLNHKRRFLCNRRGFSAIIATIFMVLAVLFLFFNVYMFIQKQDTKFQDAISQSQQLDIDRSAERVNIIINQPPVTMVNQVTINCTIINESSIPIKITRAWLTDLLIPSSYSNSSLSMVLSAGETSIPQLFSFSMSQPSGYYRLELVTSRGNLVSVNIS